MLKPIWEEFLDYELGHLANLLHNYSTKSTKARDPTERSRWFWKSFILADLCHKRICI